MNIMQSMPRLITFVIYQLFRSDYTGLKLLGKGYFHLNYFTYSMECSLTNDSTPTGVEFDDDIIFTLTKFRSKI
jgi:hypothetical protein